MALAPMAGFTDAPFRQICSSFGADVVYSEMASAAALYFRGPGTTETMKLLSWDPTKESRFVVQLFGSEASHFAVAAKIISENIRPHGVDINFGCPAGKVLKQGAGADLMKNLVKSKEIVEAVCANTDLPVSVKLRLQSGEVSAARFLDNLSDLPVSAAMVHGRTLSQGFAGEADYVSVGKLREVFPGILIVNGGINTRAEAERALRESRADGLGLGRGALGRPWLFQEIKEGRDLDLGKKEILQLLFRHAQLCVKLKGEEALIEWRKQACWYVQSLPGASRLRQSLVQVSSLEQVENLIKNI